MKETNLTFRFHNPNSETMTARIFLEVAMQANQKNIEAMILHNLSNQETQRIGKKKTTSLSVSV